MSISIWCYFTIPIAAFNASTNISVFVQKRKVPEATGWEVLCVKGSYNYLGALTRPPLQKFPKAFALENYRSIVVPLLIKLVDCIVITT